MLRWWGAVCAAALTGLGALGCSDPDAAPPHDEAGCKAGELDGPNGCEPAGISADACGSGFAADGALGCIAVLPDAVCPRGTMAVPGEVECHEPSPCGGAPWGAIPVDATTQYVDAAYAGGGSDGTESKPWTTIQAAVDAAAPGSIVAIAAGSYAEHVGVEGHSVRLWGRCPSLVEIAGVYPGAVDVRVGGDATEVHGVAVSGEYGVLVSGAKDVLVDGVWIHDTNNRGINIQDTLGSSSIIVQRSLIESAHDSGVFAGNAEAIVERSVIRGTLDLDGHGGLGAHALTEGSVTGARGRITLRSSLIELSEGGGVLNGGGDLTMEESVVRDTLPRPSDGAMGRGIEMRDEGQVRATTLVRASVVERSVEGGIAVFGADLTVEDCVVRDTAPNADHDRYGEGIHIQQGVDSDQGSVVQIARSVIERSAENGIMILSSDLTLERVIVRGTDGGPSGLFGDAVDGVPMARPASMTIRASRLEHSARAGVASFGSQVSLEATALECNRIHIDGEPSGAEKYGFADVGGNMCGCEGKPVPCKALTSNLEPPTQLP